MMNDALLAALYGQNQGGVGMPPGQLGMNGMSPWQKILAQFKGGVSGGAMQGAAMPAMMNMMNTDYSNPKSIGGGIGGTVGSIAGNAIPIPGVGPMIGSGIGHALGSAVGGLFGDGGEAEAAKKQERDRKMALLMHNLNGLGQFWQGQNANMAGGMSRAFGG